MTLILLLTIISKRLSNRSARHGVTLIYLTCKANWSLHCRYSRLPQEGQD